MNILFGVVTILKDIDPELSNHLENCRIQLFAAMISEDEDLPNMYTVNLNYPPNEHLYFKKLSNLKRKMRKLRELISQALPDNYGLYQLTFSMDGSLMHKNQDKYRKEDQNIFELEFWNQIIHPAINNIAKVLFLQKNYGEAIRSSFIEVNHLVKQKYTYKTGQELDGTDLMQKAFNITTEKGSKPNKSQSILAFNTLSNESERNIQDGYRFLFAGAIAAFRNPGAHENITYSKLEAIRLIILSSQLLYQLDKVK